MKKAFLSTSIKALLATAILLGPTTIFAQDPTPPVKVDPTPLQTKAGFLTSFAPVVEKVAPSVVTISTSKIGKGSLNANPLLNDPNFRRFFGIPDPDGENGNPDQAPAPKRGQRGGKGGKGPLQAMGLGSGVIVSAEGHILTNNHVIEGADDIEVTLGNEQRKYRAKKIGVDPGTDLAVLKIEAKNLQAVTFADSDKIRVGDIAVAVGNPFGLTQSVSMGVVSATGRSGMGIVDYENFIQTDASINPGNSGGALVDIEGRLIGINTAIFSRSGGNQGIGFAIPANLVHATMDSILKHGRVVRGYLGTIIQSLTEELSGAFNTKDLSGVLVSDVEPNGPAAKAGLKSGDIILEISGKKVPSPLELRLVVGGMSPGTKVDVKLLREGREQVIPVVLGELPNQKGVLAKEDAKDDAPDVLDGVTVADIDATNRRELNLPDNAKGVVVTNVEVDSLSAAAGIKRGDIITEINRKPVTTAQEAIDMSEKLKNEKKVLLRVSSKGQTRYVVVGGEE